MTSIKSLIVSPEMKTLQRIARGYTDSLGRKIKQTAYVGPSGKISIHQTIKAPNGSRIVSDGLMGEIPTVTKYYDKDKKLTREIIYPMYEEIYTKAGDKIFISRDKFGRTGRDVRIDVANTKERYAIFTHIRPNGQEKFVNIRKFTKQKLVDFYSYLEFDFFGKPQKQELSGMDTIKYIDESIKEKGLKEPYPAKILRSLMKDINKQRNSNAI